MEGDEGNIFSKFLDRKPLFLLNIKIKQNSGCPNKTYNTIFDHRLSGPIPEVRNICIINDYENITYCEETEQSEV